MKKTLCSILLIPALLLSFFVIGCDNASQKQPAEEKPIYSGCIFIQEIGTDYYSVGYEIHLDRAANMIIDPPEKLFQDVIQPEDWADVNLGHNSTVNPGSYCESEEYQRDWFYSQMDIRWDKENISDLVEKLEALPVSVSFEDRKTGEAFNYAEPLPVVVIPQ